MMTPAQDTRRALALAHKMVTGKTVVAGELPTAAPTATDKSVAMGRIPISGILAVDSLLAHTITIKIWNDARQKWRTPGTSSADSAKVFTADSFDYFDGPPGAPYYLYSSASGNICYDNGDEFVYKGV